MLTLQEGDISSTEFLTAWILYRVPPHHLLYTALLRFELILLTLRHGGIIWYSGKAYGALYSPLSTFATYIEEAIGRAGLHKPCRP